MFQSKSNNGATEQSVAHAVPAGSSTFHQPGVLGKVLSHPHVSEIVQVLQVGARFFLSGRCHRLHFFFLFV